MHFTEGVDGTNETTRTIQARPCDMEPTSHGKTGHGRVDGEEDVMEDHKGKEGLGLADGPGLVAMLAIVGIDGGDGRGVDSSNGDGDGRVQQLIEEVRIDLKRTGNAVEVVRGRRQRWRSFVGGEFEERGRGQANMQGRARHDGCGGGGTRGEGSDVGRRATRRTMEVLGEDAEDHEIMVWQQDEAEKPGSREGSWVRESGLREADKVTMDFFLLKAAMTDATADRGCRLWQRRR